MTRFILSAAVLTLTAGIAAAGPQTKKPADTRPVCPVMKHEVKKVTADTARSKHKGKTYYFCCAGCKPEFEKNPAKYVKAKTKPVKPGKINKKNRA